MESFTYLRVKTRWNGVSDGENVNVACWLRLRFHERPRRFAPPRAWLIATLYAATDELHQMFVSERGPAALAVCIDSAGALTGALAALAVMVFFARRQA